MWLVHPQSQLPAGSRDSLPSLLRALSLPFFLLVSHHLCPLLALALFSLGVSQIDPVTAVFGACITQKSVFRVTVFGSRPQGGL